MKLWMRTLVVVGHLPELLPAFVIWFINICLVLNRPRDRTVSFQRDLTNTHQICGIICDPPEIINRLAGKLVLSFLLGYCCVPVPLRYSNHVVNACSPSIGDTSLAVAWEGSRRTDKNDDTGSSCIGGKKPGKKGGSVRR
jgi:hypothetical protein